jgi:hypothetical protein
MVRELKCVFILTVHFNLGCFLRGFVCIIIINVSSGLLKIQELENAGQIVLELLDNSGGSNATCYSLEGG